MNFAVIYNNVELLISMYAFFCVAYKMELVLYYNFMFFLNPNRNI